VASASSAVGEAPLQLLKAAKRLEPLDPLLAQTHVLGRVGAALFAGHLASPAGTSSRSRERLALPPSLQVPRRPIGSALLDARIRG
jgi:hypothetical protein